MTGRRPMTDRESLLQALEGNHSFPGEFMFKVIGENTPELVAAVLQTVVSILGPRTLPRVSTRESSHGKHQAVTLVVAVPSARVVVDVYDALRSGPGIEYLL
jgi:putative lipoic acid-binding regulatory protein